MSSMPQMVRVRLGRRQVNPAAFSGVTDQISNAGTSAGHKAADATSGLSRGETSLVIVLAIVGFVLAVAGLFWICSCSRRRKRAREMREKSQQLGQISAPSSTADEAAFVPARSSLLASSRRQDRNSRQLGAYNSNGWGESRVALNSSFVASTNERYGWDHGQEYSAKPSMPQAPQQSYRY
ncbi:hypothetical protein PHBOTO_006033 [Pseudozyma hubeiensis]|nr:hypothetical protein PHBOTO_006033 [Pseudozyma hubeiensis]